MARSDLAKQQTDQFNFFFLVLSVLSCPVYCLLSLLFGRIRTPHTCLPFANDVELKCGDVCFVQSIQHLLEANVGGIDTMLEVVLLFPFYCPLQLEVQVVLSNAVNYSFYLCLTMGD